MENEKAFYLSKTFWGGMLAVLGAAAGVFGLSPDQLPSADEIVVIVGGVLAIIGRFTAKTTLTVS